MKTEKVDKRYVIRLTESEATVLEKRFSLSGMTSVSAYLRQQVVNGIYLEYDHEELKKIRQAVMSVANNINQIAIRVNSTSHIYKQELYEIQDGVSKLWNELHSIQVELKKLNPSNL
ncbi:plasmid mobilization relaxosome protein MobC [Ruminococcus sp.]|uniref:plasmid mobilization protein n=1 Tax=Ruminococcus sp. TaxID=41978 RepID=UPI002579C0FB|nr:plasmid mobilization relaxosome protein MobC [Ruminococcus sp.]